MQTQPTFNLTNIASDSAQTVRQSDANSPETSFNEVLSNEMANLDDTDDTLKEGPRGAGSRSSEIKPAREEKSNGEVLLEVVETAALMQNEMPEWAANDMSMSLGDAMLTADMPVLAADDMLALIADAGSEQQDTITSSAQTALGGQIMFNRSPAEAGRYPAPHIGQLFGSAMHNFASHEHRQLSRRPKRVYSRYQRSHDPAIAGDCDADGGQALEADINPASETE